MLVVRNTLAYSSYESTKPIRIELNLVTEMCAPLSIFGKYHTYHTNMYLIYLGNGCNIMHQLTNVQRQHAPTTARADWQARAWDLTSVRDTSSTHDKHAQKREHHAKELKILRQGLSLGPRGSKSRPNAKCRQAEDRSRTCRLDACERGKWG